MSHTDEYWSVGETHLDDADYPETVIRGLDGRAAIGVILDFGQNNPDMRQENARRIVACVNACAGLSIDELERFGLGSAIGTEIHGLKVERDTYRELCVELKLKLSSIESNLMVLPERYAEEWKNNVMHLWVCARNNDSRIPDDVLDFMRDMLLSAPRMNGENNAT